MSQVGKKAPAPETKREAARESIKARAAAVPPSSNWAALKKTFPGHEESKSLRGHKRKRGEEDENPSSTSLRLAAAKAARITASETIDHTPSAQGDGAALVGVEDTPIYSDLKHRLRRLVEGDLGVSPDQREGKHIALDCEMVGVGWGGTESSLARVSVVNFHGVVLLDEYVSQVERVSDYRTKWSGIRPKDLQNGLTFQEVQKRVAALMKDKIVIGHALSNDFKALLLSHPHQFTRDTQANTTLRKISGSKKPSLKNLIRLELGLDIQDAEHDSVIDARAALALFRLHKVEWDRSLPASHQLVITGPEIAEALRAEARPARVKAGPVTVRVEVKQESEMEEKKEDKKEVSVRVQQQVIRQPLYARLQARGPVTKLPRVISDSVGRASHGESASDKWWEKLGVHSVHLPSGEKKPIPSGPRSKAVGGGKTEGSSIVVSKGGMLRN